MQRLDYPPAPPDHLSATWDYTHEASPALTASIASRQSRSRSPAAPARTGSFDKPEAARAKRGLAVDPASDETASVSQYIEARMPSGASSMSSPRPTYASPQNGARRRVAPGLDARAASPLGGGNRRRRFMPTLDQVNSPTSCRSKASEMTQASTAASALGDSAVFSGATHAGPDSVTGHDPATATARGLTAPSPRHKAAEDVQHSMERLRSMAMRRVRFDSLQDGSSVSGSDGEGKGPHHSYHGAERPLSPSARRASFAGILRSRQNAAGCRQSSVWGQSLSELPNEMEVDHAPETRSNVEATCGRLLQTSCFSNLPIVDCHYDPDDDTLGVTWHRRACYDWLRWWCRTSYFVRCFCRLLNRWQFIWCVLCGLSVIVCERFRITAGIPSALWVNVLLFPLAFAVNAAYQRREGALSNSAEFKAGCLNLYLNHRCWHFDPNVPHDFLRCSCACFTTLFENVRGYLTAKTEAQVRGSECWHQLRTLGRASPPPSPKFCPPPKYF